jgi:hypothetical protein
MSRRMRRGGEIVGVVFLAIAAGCQDEAPPLPESSVAAGPPAAGVAAPEVPGRSEEYQQMELPPGQLTRALPVGDAWSLESGPTYRSRCLSCHSVSQTAFAVTDWQESLHARAGVTCAGCHGTHEAVFVPQPGPDRCLLCHAPQVTEFLASKHGPANSPGMRCVSCHEAHATDRGLAGSMSVCMGCHLDSDHVQGFPGSRMGLVLAAHPPNPDGTLRAADCTYCHAPESAVLLETGDFRNDRVTLHDPAVTVARHENDPDRLAPETIDFHVPRCATCHSERNARYRLENSDPLIRHWVPLGMTGEVRARPSPEVSP